MPKSTMREILIDSFNFPNIGLGNLDGEKVEIKNALPGQTVEALVAKRKGKYKGRIMKILERGKNEIHTACLNLGKCGGCTFQTLPYEHEIILKKEGLSKIFQGLNIDVNNFVTASNIYAYRNKMEFSFGDEYKGGPLNLGLRGPGNYYEVCDGSLCNICDEDFNNIVSLTKEYFKAESFYNRMKHTGTLRHLVIRKGERTGEILVNLVSTDRLIFDAEKFVNGLLKLKLEGEIGGILHTINNSVADIVQADETRLLYGNDFFFDRILGFDFKIYPYSFFQTNTIGAEKLYETVREFCGEEKVNTIFDLYCGTGTIAQILSSNAEKVYGIEIVESAIKAAKENALLNNIKNCIFISGDVLKEVEKLPNKPDIIILDPPRDGIHPKAIEHIINFNAEKIIYISCKPTSLARDLQFFLDAEYKLVQSSIHDMFPRSYHVETICLLIK